jgi:hypothetical protein
MSAAAKPEVNRSQVIRDFVAKNPAMPISEVVTALGKEGVKVSKKLVYMVKIKMKAKKAKEKKAKAAAKESQPAAIASSNGSAKAPTKSAAVRAFLRGNRKMTAKDVVSAMAGIDQILQFTLQHLFFSIRPVNFSDDFLGKPVFAEDGEPFICLYWTQPLNRVPGNHICMATLFDQLLVQHFDLMVKDLGARLEPELDSALGLWAMGSL